MNYPVSVAKFYSFSSFDVISEAACQGKCNPPPRTQTQTPYHLLFPLYMLHIDRDHKNHSEVQPQKIKTEKGNICMKQGQLGRNQTEEPTAAI